MHKLNTQKTLQLVLLAMTLVTVSLFANTSATAASATISHSYHVTTAIPAGSLVSLASGKSDTVEPSDSGDGDHLIGVAVGDKQSLLAIDPRSGQTQVAVSGTVSALVSTLNGDITTGSHITASALKGVGIKAATGDHVIGVADADFTSRSVGATSQSIRDSKGRSHQVSVGYIPVTIGITTLTDSGGPELNSLQKLVKSLTGHVISTARILLAIVVTVLALSFIITLSYGSIYGSIISIGRNPLAKFVILKSLTGVLIMTSLTAFIAMITVYLLLH